jgi:hypothetical protein
MHGKVRCELIDLHGRVVARSVVETGAADRLLSTLRQAHCNGVYLVKLTDMKNGKTIMRRSLAAGR